MVSEADVTEVQVLYPRIYIACHKEHVRAASSEAQISDKDSAILAHLTVEELTTPSKLARHLQISPSTLSEAIARLVGLGYVHSKMDENDERRQRLVLTEKGQSAMKESSVLDTEKLTEVLSRLNSNDRKRAIEGLALLANACLPSADRFVPCR